jgi:hypothetical protein
MPRHLARLLLPLGLGLAAGQAWAQEPEPNPNVPVQNRPRPDYDPLGIRAGAFLVYPSMTLEGAYDDNVFAESDNEKSDFIGIVSPRIRAQSQWSRHALAVDAGGAFGFYRKYTGNNYQDFDVGATGRVDVTREDRLNLNARVGRQHEDRSSPDDPSREATSKVTEYWFGNFVPSYRHNFARFFTIVNGNFRRFDFENAGDVDNNDRDRWRYGGGLRLGYEVSPRLNLFVQGDYRWVRYDEGKNNRNNEGYALRAGTGIDITGIIFGEASLGYTGVTYDNSNFSNVNGLSADGSITWNITPLTTLIFTGGAEVQETTVSRNDQEASGDLQYVAGVEATHELLRNVLLSANASYIRDDFEGADRTDNTYVLGAGVRYLINRNFSLTADYTFSDRSSDESGADYTRNVFRIGVTARM